MNLPIAIGLRYTAAKRHSRSVSFLAGVSVTGLIVGISLLVLVLSVMNGFDRELRERILGLVPQAAVYHRNSIDDWKALQGELEIMSGVIAASPFVEIHGLVSHNNQTDAVVLYGYDSESEERVSLINSFVNADATTRLDAGEPVILLGKGVAESIGAQQGDRVMIVVPSGSQGRNAPKLAYFEVAQILESQTELDSTLALTSLSLAAELSGQPDTVSGMRLKLHDLFSAPSTMYGINLALGQSYYTNNWTRTHWNLYQAIQMSKNLVGLLMSLIVAIAAFNVVSTLVLVVVDKQGDIAILRTLGLSTRNIMTIFMAQGAVIGVIGTSLGLVCGCVLSLGAEHAVVIIESIFNVQFLKSDVYPLTYVPTEIRAEDLISVGITSIFMSFLATLYPAWKASRIQPAEALRYE